MAGTSSKSKLTPGNFTVPSFNARVWPRVCKAVLTVSSLIAGLSTEQLHWEVRSTAIVFEAFRHGESGLQPRRRQVLPGDLGHRFEDFKLVPRPVRRPERNHRFARRTP